jgi:hypothetical protein
MVAAALEEFVLVGRAHFGAGQSLDLALAEGKHFAEGMTALVKASVHQKTCIPAPICGEALEHS